jgi:Uma2 family endonuclease
MATALEQTDVLEAGHTVTESFSTPELSEQQPEKLTLEQADELAGGRSFELIDGRMVFKMPDDKHSDTQSLMGARLTYYFFDNPIGRVRTEFTFRPWPENPHEGRIPDLSVILNESLEKDERYATQAPDLAIEIVSPDDKWSELFDKAELYLEKGSKVVWIVDPYRQSVMVVTADEMRWEKEKLVCPELLPGFSVTMAEIFTWPEKAS